MIPFVRELVVDKERTFTPMRVVSTKNGLQKRYADHLAITVSMCDLPSSNQKFEIQTKWNLKKPGGWEKYIVATEDIATKIVNLVEEESNIDEVIKKVERLHNKAKFVAFDKTKIKQNKSTNKKILREQDTNKAEDLISRQTN